ncbi:MAG: hypothetical protein KAW93_05085, partial [Methanogenium sp.]|nr:hypothetical protein [Methanogenium sp.]
SLEAIGGNFDTYLLGILPSLFFQITSSSPPAEKHSIVLIGIQPGPPNQQGFSLLVCMLLGCPHRDRRLYVAGESLLIHLFIAIGTDFLICHPPRCRTGPNRLQLQNFLSVKEKNNFRIHLNT